MKYNIITIEREYASGGREIGNRLAKKLQIPCYGKEILEWVAAQQGTTSEQLRHLEETTTNSFLYSIAMATRMTSGDITGLSKENELYLAEARKIAQLADQGSCVLVGRCSSWILRDREDVLNVFIHADMDFRKQRAIEVNGIDPSKAEAVLRKSDKRRSNFCSANTGKKWDDRSEYHLVLDSGKLGIEQCVQIINKCLDV